MAYDIQWALVIFSLLAGVGGMLACSVGVAQLMGKAREGRFVACIVSLALIVVGGLASVAHLALPLNAFYAITNLASFSGISIELMMLAITFVVVLVYAILLKRYESAEGALKVFAILSIIAGLLLAFACGHGYVIEARWAWDTNLLPLAYLGSVMPVGAFGYLAIAGRLGATHKELMELKIYVIACVVISVLSCIAYLAYIGVDMMARNVLVSWVFIVLVGIVGEIAVLVWYLKSTSAQAVFKIAVIGAILALVCGLGVRIEMWVASDSFFDAFYWEIENGTPIAKDDY